MNDFKLWLIQKIAGKESLIYNVKLEYCKNLTITPKYGIINCVNSLFVCLDITKTKFKRRK